MFEDLCLVPTRVPADGQLGELGLHSGDDHQLREGGLHSGIEIPSILRGILLTVLIIWIFPQVSFLTCSLRLQCCSKGQFFDPLGLPPPLPFLGCFLNDLIN